MDASKIDVDSLFRQFNVKEISAIEMRIKNEIEKKKEELRLMVYNRYRDIIEAADAIHVMKSCSKQIEDILNSLQINCDSFRIQDTKPTSAVEKPNAKYVLAVIIKVLQNSPSKIWYHLDNNEYLKATIQYLYAQHVHVCLDLEKTLRNEKNSYQYMNYGNELWNSIVFLKNTIINKSKSMFQTVHLSSDVTMDAMISIILLENTSLQNIFEDFLAVRTPTICLLLSTYAFDEINVNVKDRLIDMLDAFTVTIFNIYDIFYADSVAHVSNGQRQTYSTNQTFTSKLNSSCSIVDLLKNDGFVVHKMPSYLLNFQYRNVNFKSVDVDILGRQCVQWLANTIDKIKVSVGDSFKYVTTLKSLSFIKSSINDFISKKLNGSQWTQACMCLFNANIDLWEQIVSPFYYKQFQTVIETYLANAHANLINRFNEHLTYASNELTKSAETDINSYLWCEPGTADDYQVEITELFSSNADKKNNDRLMTYKTKAITPALQKLFKCLDDDLNKLIQDIDESLKDPTHVQQQNDVHSTHHSQINQYLQVNSALFIDKIMESFQSFVGQLEEQSHKAVDASTVDVTKLILIARFAHALPMCCPQMKLILNYYNVNVANRYDSKKRLQTALSVDHLHKAVEQDDVWTKFTVSLGNLCAKIYGIWTNHICKQLKSKYLNNALDDVNACSLNDSIVGNLLVWDEIEIEDELEEGKQCKSKIIVPVVCSALIQNMLHDVCNQLIKTFPYTIIHSIVKDLNQSMLRLILKSFQDKISRSKSQQLCLSQNTALQMIFDLKYLSNLFDIKDDANDLKSECKNICSQLEDFIDPFDFDILTPFIQSNINKSIARSMALYGILSSNDKYTRNTQNQTIASDVHNLLLLSNNTQRFELLPIATNPTMMTNQSRTMQASIKHAKSDKESAKTNNETSFLHTVASASNLGKDSAVSAFYKKWFQ